MFSLEEAGDYVDQFELTRPRSQPQRRVLRNFIDVGTHLLATLYPEVDISFQRRSCRIHASPLCPAHPSHHLPMARAACRRDLRRAGGGGKESGVLSRAAGAECPPYFDDQVTGRLVARSG